MKSATVGDPVYIHISHTAVVTLSSSSQQPKGAIEIQLRGSSEKLLKLALITYTGVECNESYSL